MKKLILSLITTFCCLLSFAQQQFDYQAHSTTGSDTYTVSITNVTAYSSGTPERGIGFSIIFDTPSTGDWTLNVNGLGAIPGNGVILEDSVYRLEYNVVTDRFTMISGGGGTESLFPTTGTGTATGNVTGDLDGNNFEAVNAGYVNIGGSGFQLEMSSSGSALVVPATSGSNFIQVENGGGLRVTTNGTQKLNIQEDGGWYIGPTGAGTAGQVLTNNGATSSPSWEDPAGGISDGDYGDITVSGGGTTWTVDNTAITYAKFQDLTGLSIFGRSANSSGVGASITAGTDNQVLRRSGTSIGFGAVNIASSDAVTGVLGSSNGGAGSVNGIMKANGSGTVSAASAGTDYLAPSGSGAALTDVWLAASGATLSGANTITATTTNILKIVVDNLTNTQTNGAGIWLENTTAATNGTVQNSPSLVFDSKAYSTTSSASQSAKFGMWVQPTQGTTIQGTLMIRQSINNAAYQEVLRIGSASVGFPSTGTVGTLSGATLNLATNNASRVAISGTGDVTVSNGNLTLNTAGNGLLIKTGTNATFGTATLVGGTVTVNTTKTTANSVIMLTSQTDGGTPGFLRISGRSAGTSFTVTSSSGTDTSTFGWVILEPAP